MSSHLHSAKVMFFDVGAADFEQTPVFRREFNTVTRGAFEWIRQIPGERSKTHTASECCLKQQNQYLSVIIVCGYLSFIRSFTWLNLAWESNSYHKTSLSMTFGSWHLSGVPLFSLHFVVYTIAWQRKFETKWVLNTHLQILSGLKCQIPATFITCILRNSHII